MPIVYRYDNEDYAVGRVVAARGDHIDSLTGPQREVELLLRAASATAGDLRMMSLYTWEDRDIARRLCHLKRAKFLYEMEIEGASVRHRGDVNLYSAAVDAVLAGEPTADFIAKYWCGEIAGPPWTPPRIEILVSEAKVIRKFTRAEL
jgi:hypothetical protein